MRPALKLVLFGATSSASGSVVDPVPVNSVLPVISGTTQVGQNLSCTTGTWTLSPSSYAYQWKRNGSNIGTNSSTYPLVGADTATNITCTVIATNAVGPSLPATSNTLAIDGVAANTVAPVISGTTSVGNSLSCTTGTWTFSPTSYGYQWYRDGVFIPDEDSSTYLLVLADATTDITCAVIATNPQGASSPAVSNTLTIDAEATLAAPTLDLAASSDLGSSSTDDITSDTTPTLTATFPGGLLEDDIITIRDDGVELDDHTVTAGEAGGTPIDLGLSALTDGEHSIDIRLERGAEFSEWSDPLVLTIDATGPTMTSSATTNVDEADQLAFALTASEASTFAKTGGVDTAQFATIVGSTLTWFGDGVQDSETPLDSGTNNTYVVEVTPTATLSGAVGTPQSITVTVNNVAEGSWSSLVDLTFTADDNDWQGLQLRQVFAVASYAGGAPSTGTKLRVTFVTSTGSGATNFAQLYIGHRSGGEAAPSDYSTPNAQIAIGGDTTPDVASNTTALSDEITFAFDKTKALVVAMSFGANGDARKAFSTTNITQFYGSGSPSAPTGGGGLSANGNNCTFVRKIEVFG